MVQIQTLRAKQLTIKHEENFRNHFRYKELQQAMKKYKSTTKETKKLRDEMLSIHPNSPSWREAVISLYRDELQEFVATATTPYKRVIFERDWEYMRSDLRSLVNRPILLCNAVTN